jgi:methionyl-tRNA formyltransferase
MAGDEKTGVTIMYMEKGLDTGNIILQQEVVIEENETYDTLYKKLSEASYKLVKENISSLFSKDVKSQKQDSALVTQAKVITPEEESID